MSETVKKGKESENETAWREGERPALPLGNEMSAFGRKA